MSQTGVHHGGHLEIVAGGKQWTRIPLFRPSQLSMVGARARECYDKYAKDRQRASGGDRKSKDAKSVPVNLPEPTKSDARDAVGKTVGVSGKSIDHATRVIKQAIPEVDIVILATIDDAVKLLKAERDSNQCRKPFTPSELVDLGKRIELLEKPKAAERKSPGVNQHTKEVSGKLPETSKGDTRDKVADALGVSGKTYEKAKAVVEAADDVTLPEEVREVAREAVKQMDASGNT